MGTERAALDMAVCTVHAQCQYLSYLLNLGPALPDEGTALRALNYQSEGDGERRV